MNKPPAFLAVGNFDSNVGYAWRLMESFWCHISKKTTAYGFKSIICFPSISIVPNCLTEENFVAEQLDFSKRNLSNVISQALFMRRRNVKIIYFTDFSTWSLSYLLYRAVGVKKIIIHDHTPGARKRPNALKFLLKKLIHKVNWLCADACFAVSPYIAQRMVEVNGVPSHKIHCITNGIPVPDATEPQRASDRINIVTVARANYYKGIDFALQVVARLKQIPNQKPITYTLFGDGPNLQEFTQLAATLGIEKDVTFAGKASGIAEKLLSFHIAFHPSKGEAMSLAILEYMRAYLPVVVPSNPSVSSFLKQGETAKIYAESSIDSAVTTIQSLIESDELRKTLGQNARKEVSENFNDQRMYESLNNSISSVLAPLLNIKTP